MNGTTPPLKLISIQQTPITMNSNQWSNECREHFQRLSHITTTLSLCYLFFDNWKKIGVSSI